LDRIMYNGTKVWRELIMCEGKEGEINIDGRKRLKERGRYQIHGIYLGMIGGWPSI